MPCSRYWRRAACVALLIPVGFGSTAEAQTTRAEALAALKAEKAKSLRPPDPLPGQRITDRIENLSKLPPKLIFPLGGMRGGASFAPGVGYLLPVAENGVWSNRVGWSIKNFKLFESSLKFSNLANGRATATMYGRWQDAPTLRYLGRGNFTVRAAETRYSLRSIEAGWLAAARPHRLLVAAGGVEYLAIDAGPGAGTPSVETVFPQEPGVGAKPRWLHSQATLGIDWRTSPGYTRRGGLYQVTYHDYRDVDGHPFDFGLMQIDVRQFVPVLNENWVFAVQGYAEITSKTSGQSIPFFMLPYLGGGGGLRGYPRYRFTDRHSLLISTELRWTPLRMLDMAIFMDHGKVASRVQDLDLDNLHRSWGFGARFHGPSFTALRLELARSREGWRYHIAQGVSF